MVVNTDIDDNDLLEEISNGPEDSDYVVSAWCLLNVMPSTHSLRLEQ